MTAISVNTQRQARNTDARWSHRKTCILAGGLAALGGTLAILVHPWFAVAAAVGGIWLMFSPDPI
jgi:hypothetical protein